MLGLFHIYARSLLQRCQVSFDTFENVCLDVALAPRRELPACGRRLESVTSFASEIVSLGTNFVSLSLFWDLFCVLGLFWD